MVKPGDRIDRYLIEEPIGEGGMGRVFRAHDERLDRHVALKVLLGGEGDDQRPRLLREARAVAKLDHPNIVAVYDVGEHNDGPYVAMELIEGRTLRSLIGDGAVPPAERVRVMTDVARALSAAHDAGIVHRDIKPENVIIRKDGRVKVLDFGIARRTQVGVDPSAPTDHSLNTLTAEGVKVGTPTYMAPEQIRGSAIDGRSDQFAWAVTAYEIFVGRPPWSGDAMALLAAVLTQEAPPPPARAMMPPAFASVVWKALAKQPEQRFGSMHEVVATIEAAGLGSAARGGSLPPASFPPGSGPPGSRPPGSAGRGPRSPRMVPHPQQHVASAPPAASYRPSPTLSRRYSTQEVSDIFDRALAAQQRNYRYAELAEAAREIGLDEGTLQESMSELARRGAVEASERQREADMYRVKRLAAIWGVFAAFFFLLNISDLRGGLWFQYPAISIGLPFGLLIVRALFPSRKRALPSPTPDRVLEHDVAQVAHYLRVRSAAAPQPESRARIAAQPSVPQPPAPTGPIVAQFSSETERQLAAEIDALAHDEAERAAQK